MITNQKLFLSLIFSLIPIIVGAQPAIIDSLKSELLIQTQKDTNRVKLLLDVARRTYRNEPIQSRAYAREALVISQMEDYVIGQAHANRYIGYSFNAQMHQDSALFYMDEALKLYESLNDSRGIAIINGAIGTTYAMNDEFELAITKMLDALEAYKELENYSAIGVMYNNIGNIYLE